MDTPENYYAILGVPLDANNDMLKRAYRQLARRFHPDLAGPEGAIEMKRINRAYAVLSDSEKRRQYDVVIGGVIDLRGGNFARPRPRPHTFDPNEDIEFSGLNVFSTRGPLHAHTRINTSLGVITALNSIRLVHGFLVAAGSLDAKGLLWQIVDDKVSEKLTFAVAPSAPIESLREIRLSPAGSLIAGWNRLSLHVWDAYTGDYLWNYSLLPRAVSAHYSLDMALEIPPDQKRFVHLALPLLGDDNRTPRAWGVRASDVVNHEIGQPDDRFRNTLVCMEEGVENRQFWAIRLRALSHDARKLLTLSCGRVPDESQEVVIVRLWDLTMKGKLGGKVRPQIISSIVLGRCADCAPPYAFTPDLRMLAFAYRNTKLLVYDTTAGTYSELPTGTLGSSARLAFSTDAQWLAVAREDSEINEGVIDVWSISTGQVIQKLYHPWQISALHFAEKQLLVGLTDGTIQLWE